MTVIVAAKRKDGRVTVAADRQSTTGSGGQFENAEPKLWVDGKYVIGCAGDVRVAQVLRFTADWPEYNPKSEPSWLGFVVTQIVPEMRRVLADQVAPMEDFYLGSATTLIAVRDRFAVIYENGVVLADRTGRTAIGSGAPEALGYLGNQGPWKAADVATAVSRAAITDAGVSGPISIADTRSLEVLTEDE